MQAQTFDPLLLPLDGLRLIEASAGTGKTYTIASLYLRLVLGAHSDTSGPRPLTPPEILVVTYTRAAAEELRARIRERLHHAALYFRAVQTQTDDLVCRELYQRMSCDSEREVAAFRLEQAAAWMDEAAIFTLHAWCQRLLTRYAFASGEEFEFTLDDAGSGASRQLALADWWRQLVYPQTPVLQQFLIQLLKSPKEVAQTVYKLPQSAPKSRQPLTELLGDLDDALQHIDIERRALQAQFLAVQQEVLDALLDALNNKQLNGRRYRPKSLPNMFESITQWLSGWSDKGIDADLAKLQPQALQAATNKGEHHWQAPMPELFIALNTLRETQLALQPDQLKIRLFEHAHGFTDAWLTGDKKRRGSLSFDDLLQKVANALDGPMAEHIAMAIRQAWPQALVDEFQDTDPLQYRSLRRIYHAIDGVGLLMIGDPKQAIYAFRGADIHTYLNARADAQSIYGLKRNYRSTSALVEAVEQVFLQADKAPEGPFGHAHIHWQSVSAQGRTEQLIVDQQPVPALTFAELGGPYGKGAYQTLAAQAAAQTIARLLSPAAHWQNADQLSPVRGSDIAVLVRTFAEAQIIRTALTACGVASVYLSERDSVYATAEAGLLMVILRAAAEPLEERLLRAALAEPLLGFSHRALQALLDDDRLWQQTLERWLGYRTLWLKKGPLAMLRTLFADYTVAAHLLCSDDGERRLTNLLHLAELLQTEQTLHQGPESLLRFFALQCSTPDERMDDNLLRLESDANLVRVVTIHKSKGLEYPLVFLPFVAASSESKDVLWRSWQDASGSHFSWLGSADWVQACTLQSAEERAESLRLLYVALTRARHALWLGVAAIGKPNKSEYKCAFQHSALGYLLNAGQPQALPPDRLAALLSDLSKHQHIAYTPVPADQEVAQSLRPPRQNLQPARTVTRDAGRPWLISSYTAIASGQRRDSTETTALEATLFEAHTALETPLEAAVDPLASMPAGAALGTLVHAILEQAAQLPGAFAQALNEPEQSAQRIEALAVMHAMPMHTQALVDVFPRWLQMPIAAKGGGHFCLAELKPGALIAEMEFWCGLDTFNSASVDALVQSSILPGNPRPALRGQSFEGVLKGFVDLICEHQGQYYIIDYKSNRLENYMPSDLDRAILDHRYELQYCLYLVALRRLLLQRQIDAEQVIGGARYLFLRGVDLPGAGVHVSEPDAAFLHQLDQLL